MFLSALIPLHHVMAESPQTTTFPLFSALAAELRNQIWQYALPDCDSIKSTLAPWRPGLWTFRGAEPDLEFRFAHERLEVPFSIPLASVNREARSIVLSSIESLPFKARVTYDCNGILVFMREFDRLKDAMYIEPAQIIAILEDANEHLERDDMIGVTLCVYSEFKTIAMSATHLHSSNAMKEVPDVLEPFCSVNELFVIVNEYDGRPCTFERAPGDVLRWTHSSGVFSGEEDEEYIGDGVVASLVVPERVRVAFTGVASIFGQDGLVVRPVRAISRRKDVRRCEYLIDSLLFRLARKYRRFQRH